MRQSKYFKQCNIDFIAPIWLKELNKEEIIRVLVEYQYLVRRFNHWFVLTIGKADNQKIRELLIPNLLDEVGDSHIKTPHTRLLENVIIGIAGKYFKIPVSKDTKQIEQKFYNLFDNGSLYQCLCALGPATECISYQFLEPMESSIKKNFGDSVDYAYFDEHRPEKEAQHSMDLLDAIKVYEAENPKSPELKDKDSLILQGVELHNEFWMNLKNELIGNLMLRKAE